MKDYIFEFRKAVRNTSIIDEYDEFVNDFMWYNNLFGEDMYNELMKELEIMEEYIISLLVKKWNG